MPLLCPFVFFFFNDTATTEIYTLSLHDALPISQPFLPFLPRAKTRGDPGGVVPRRALADEPLRLANGLRGRREELADGAFDRGVEILREFVHESDAECGLPVEALAGQKVAPCVRADLREDERRDHRCY